MAITKAKPRSIIIFLVTFSLLLLLSCAPSAPAETTPDTSNELTASTNANADTSVPGKPTNLVLAVNPGTTKLFADWDPITKSTSYQVRWRLRRQSFAADANQTSPESDAEIDLPSQGNWIIRVQACNDHGCGEPATSSTDVIINVLGHTAVRAWATDHTLEIDWDPLPGKYQVKYRLSTDSSKWKTSQLLDNPGLSIAATDLQDFAGTGHPIVRVYFNCDADGERCSPLGRWPDRSVQDANTGRVPLPPPATATGARSVNTTPDRIPDSVTGVLRPRSDFTFTTEEDADDEGSWSCVSRPSENRWETQTHGDTVKRCSRNRVETDEPYELDPSATFPDGAICGTRKAKTEEERQIYGDTVRVCNHHPDPNDDGTSTPQPKPGTRTHTGDSHQVG